MKMDNLFALILEMGCSPSNHFVSTVYPKRYAHGFGVLCFVVVMQSFIINLHEVFIHIRQGCFVGTGAIVRLPQCQWSKPDWYGKISQCITTTKHSKAKPCAYFLGYTVYDVSGFVQQSVTRIIDVWQVWKVSLIFLHSVDEHPQYPVLILSIESSIPFF